MEDPAPDPQSRQHSLRDWLALHELDPPSCRRILQAMINDRRDAPVSSKQISVAYQAPDVETAWGRAAEALVSFLPGQESLVTDTLDQTAKILVDQATVPGRAVTVDNGPMEYPTIVYSYRGEPADFLVIAHEFGHAVQITASCGKFVPPVMREVCAFLGEHALLEQTLRLEPIQYSYLRASWAKTNRKYLGTQKDLLLRDLTSPDTLYNYRWNYPIARYLARLISEQFTGNRRTSVFEGELTVLKVLHELKVL